ncbi:Ribulose-Phosphate 3-Epimerase-Like Protein 1 [Manis pentadactyla]|nr:Ribulose-Phosphate 3-Epimerase-Like Protein 1 [Manis pentadactyla]
MARLSFMFTVYGMTDIEADGVGSETLALRKELGSGSDVTGSARCWNRFMRANVAIQFQDYSEAIVVSMVILEFRATGPR